MLSATQDAAVVVRRHLELALSVQAAAILALNKLTSAIIKVFSEIAVHGFCPLKEMDEEGAKGDEELKSSEKETGLGQGEGAKDVSDQIDNEDMLDGAYQNPEDRQDKEEKDNKEDTGIEMSDNFDSNLQDRKEEAGEEDDEEDKEGEREDETGDVEGNEDLDKDMWRELEDEKEDKAGLEDSEEQVKTNEENMVELAAKEDKEKNSNGDKRERKEEEKEKDEKAQEFDDH
jgi:midasin